MRCQSEGWSPSRSARTQLVDLPLEPARLLIELLRLRRHPPRGTVVPPPALGLELLDGRIRTRRLWS